jgi:hypothetical protein
VDATDHVLALHLNKTNKAIMGSAEFNGDELWEDGNKIFVYQ